MRALILLLVLLNFAAAHAGELLAVDSYDVKVKMTRMGSRYQVLGYDEKRRPLVAVSNEEFIVTGHNTINVYMFGVADVANGTWRAHVISEEIYKRISADLQSAPMNTAYRSWLSGCAVKIQLDDARSFAGSMRECPPQ